MAVTHPYISYPRDAVPPNGAKASNDDNDPPTFDEPLRGLNYLARVALLGRQRILELAAQPIDYLWQDIAVAGTIILFAGPPSEGKTTLLFLALAARATTGDPVRLLNRTVQPAPAGRYVVIIEGEHSEASASRKLVKSLTLMGVDDSALERIIIIARKAVTLGSPEWEEVLQLIRAGLVSDIAIDTIARVAPGDANDEREQVAVFDVLARALEAAPEGQPQPTAWVVGHTRKRDGKRIELSDVSGSVQRTGQADTVITVAGEKVDGQTVSSTATFAKLREDPDEYPMPVTYSIVTGPEGAPEIVYSDGREQTDERPLEERIVELLKTGPKTKNALRETLGRRAAHVEAAIDNLFAAGQLKTTNVRIRGRSFRAFDLREQWGARTAAEHEDYGLEFDNE